MKNRYGLLLTLLAFIAAAPGADAQSNYGKSYAINGETLTIGYLSQKLQLAPDGGLFWSGIRGQYIEGGNSFLVRTNPDGSIRFSKSASSYAAAPAMTANGGFLVATNHMIGIWGHEFDRLAIVRFDTNGQEQWRYAYYPTDTAVVIYPNWPYSAAHGVSELANGQIRVMGSMKTYSQQTWTPSLVQATLLTLNDTGDLLQSRVFSSATYEVRFNEMQATPDGGFIVLGSSQLPNDYVSTGSVLAKFDAQENLVWSKRYHNQNYETINGLIQSPDGSYMVYGNTGGSQGAAYVRKIAPNGDVIWTRLFNTNSGMTNDISSGLLMPDSSFLFSASLNGSDSRRVMLRMNQLGDTVSTRMEDPGFSRGPFQLVRNTDGSYTFASSAFLPVPGTSYNNYLPVLIRYAPGQQPFNCGTSYFPFPVAAQTAVATALPLTETSGGIIRQAIGNMVYSDNMQSSDFACTVLSAAGSVEPAVAVAAFPNPAQSELTLHFAAGHSELTGISVVVHSVTGQEQYRTDTFSSGQLQIDCSNWASGMYFYRVTGKEGVLSTGKVIIAR